MTFSDGTIRKVLKLLLKYKLSPEGTIVTGELTFVSSSLTWLFFSDPGTLRTLAISLSPSVATLQFLWCQLKMELNI